MGSGGGGFDLYRACAGAPGTGRERCEGRVHFSADQQQAEGEGRDRDGRGC